MIKRLLARSFTITTALSQVSRRRRSSMMSAWRIHNYSPEFHIKLNQSTKIPTITRPNEILIKVKAASLNPFDARMIEGYGRTFIGLMRQIDQRTFTTVSEFPLTLGRDCSGVVVETGPNVRKFKSGQEVWCALGAERQGSFAEYVIADACSVSLKPKKLNFVESASMPYVACTVWSALCTGARLDRATGRQSVLIHGGSGGIGTFAIQLAKAYGAIVTTTCSTDAFKLVSELGADNVVDYKDEKVFDKLADYGPFDIIFDSVDTDLSRKTVDLLGLWRNSTFVTVATPLLSDSDNLRFPFGLFRSALSFVPQFAQHLSNGRLYLWAFVVPNGEALNKIAKLVDDGKIRPVIDKIYKFNELPDALKKVSLMHGRGKIVIDMSSQVNETVLM